MVGFLTTSPRALLLEKIHPLAEQALRQRGWEVESLSHACTESELLSRISSVHFLGIRSKTCLSSPIFEAAHSLISVGAFCIGTNQIELDAATQRGIPVFNAPYSNTRSVVELTLGEMILLLRGIFPKSAELHQGAWNKSADASVEIRGKVLGIVGYGNIGSQLSVLAEAMGMRVLFFDITDRLAMGNAHKCHSLPELLSKSDVVTVHVDGRESNRHLINRQALDSMKPGSIFLNLSRGHVVDLAALKEALCSGHLLGAAIDVFPQEPSENGPGFLTALQGLSNVILTPHIGGSTVEAQENIAQFVSHKWLHFFERGDSHGAVNFPEIQTSRFEGKYRILHTHHNVPGMLAQINAVFAQAGINITAQHLQTRGALGYVISDISDGEPETLVDRLKQIPHTVGVRSLVNHA